MIMASMLLLSLCVLVFDSILRSQYETALKLHVLTESRPLLADSVQQFGSGPIVHKSVFQLAAGCQDIQCGTAQM